MRGLDRGPYENESDGGQGKAKRDHPVDLSPEQNCCQNDCPERGQP